MPDNFMPNNRFSVGESPTNPVLMTSSLSWGKRRFAKTGFDVFDNNRVPGNFATGSLALDDSDARDYIPDCPTEHLC
jgi:hypothetical protein